MHPEEVDFKAALRRAHGRLGRRAFGTLLGGALLSAVLGLGGEAVRRAVHDDAVTTTTTTTTTTAPGLGAPTLTASATSPRTARLTWTEPPGDPTGYVVYRDGAVHLRLAGRSFVDTGLVPGRAYEYAVTARNALGKQSPKSAAVTVRMPPVAPPTRLAARATPGAVALSWAPSSDEGVVAYLVARDGTQLARVEAGTRSHRDTGVEQLRSYEYQVRALDGAGNESAPASITVTATDDQPPTVPRQVDVSVQQGTTKVRWQPSTDNVGVSTYEVRREGSVVGTVDGDTTSYDDPGVHFDEDYTVVAIDAAGNRSAPSAPDRENQVD